MESPKKADHILEMPRIGVFCDHYSRILFLNCAELRAIVRSLQGSQLRSSKLQWR